MIRKHGEKSHHYIKRCACIAKPFEDVFHEVNGEKVGFDYDDPDELIEKLGMTSEQEVSLTTVVTNELKAHLAKAQKVPIYQIELRMTT